MTDRAKVWQQRGVKILVLLFASAPILWAANWSIERDSWNAYSEAEKQRLRDDYAKFKQLPKREQEELREFHAALTEDSPRGHKLRQTADAYLSWRDLLPTDTQTALDSKTKPDERIALIKSIVKKQDSLLEAEETRIYESLPNLFRQRDARIAELEKKLSKSMSRREQAQFNALEGPNRFFYLMVLAPKYGAVDLDADAQRMFWSLMQRVISPALAKHSKLLRLKPPSFRDRNPLEEVGKQLKEANEELKNVSTVLVGLYEHFPKDKLIAFLDDLEEGDISTLRFLEQPSPTMLWMVVALYYAVSHPDEVPKELEPHLTPFNMGIKGEKLFDRAPRKLRPRFQEKMGKTKASRA